MDRLIRTWGLLIALTLTTTGLAIWDPKFAAPGLVLLAWLKAREILGGFLHLRAAPGWLAAFTFPLAIWLAAIGALLAVR